MLNRGMRLEMDQNKKPCHGKSGSFLEHLRCAKWMGAGVPINQPLGSYWHLLGGADSCHHFGTPKHHATHHHHLNTQNSIHGAHQRRSIQPSQSAKPKNSTPFFWTTFANQKPLLYSDSWTWPSKFWPEENLVGGFLPPIWKICSSQIGSSPQVGWKYKIFETTT